MSGCAEHRECRVPVLTGVACQRFVVSVHDVLARVCVVECTLASCLVDCMLLDVRSRRCLVDCATLMVCGFFVRR